MLGLAAHMGNFELAAILIPKTIHLAIYAVYRPLANKRSMQDYQNKEVVPVDISKALLIKEDDGFHAKVQSILILVADQNPSKIEKAVLGWFFKHGDRICTRTCRAVPWMDLPIVYFDLKQNKSGKYGVWMFSL